MSAIQNNTSTLFNQIASSKKATIVTCLILATLTALTVSLSAWAHVEVAAMYGSDALIQRATYMTFIPVGITLALIAAITLLIRKYKHLSATSPTISHTPPPHIPSTQQTITPQPQFFESTAPCAGKCIVIHKQVGDKVNKGDPLLILESMKMHISVVAKNTGTITEIHTLPGTIVSQNHPLMRLELG